MRAWTARPRHSHRTGIFGLTASERQIRPPRAKLRGNQYQLGAVELAAAAVSKVLDSFFNDICAKRPAGIDGYCSLMGQGGSCFRMSTLSGACVLCVLVRHLMG